MAAVKRKHSLKRFDMRHNIPIQTFENLVGEGLWVGHEFDVHGEQVVVAAIGQAEVTPNGERVIPIDVLGAKSKTFVRACSCVNCAQKKSRKRR